MKSSAYKTNICKEKKTELVGSIREFQSKCNYDAVLGA